MSISLILLFLAVIVVLVVVHEFGHFLMAKLFGIRVDEFGIGYPPKAFSLGRIGETEYTINWIPFGGFVRILGESHEAKLTPEEKKRALVGKPAWVQLLVLGGGVLFNALFAWILFSISFMLGAPTAVPDKDAAQEGVRLVISAIIPDTPAAQSTLQAGDTILALEAGKEQLTDSLTPERVASFIQKHPGDPITFTVFSLKQQATTTVTLTPAHGVLTDAPGKPAVGIAMNLVTSEKQPFFKALELGARATWESLLQVLYGFRILVKQAFTGSVNWQQLAGPVGIANIVGEASSMGLIYLLHVVAFISINLVVINLIPVPALDGGRMLFVLIEALIRRPLPSVLVMGLNLLGFGFLIILMLVITYHDIMKYIAPWW